MNQSLLAALERLALRIGRTPPRVILARHKRARLRVVKS